MLFLVHAKIPSDYYPLCDVIIGEINRVGVVRPLPPDIYLPVLRTLDSEGITPHVTITKM